MCLKLVESSCRLCAREETTFLRSLSSCSVQWPQRDCKPVTARWHRWNICKQKPICFSSKFTSVSNTRARSHKTPLYVQMKSNSQNISRQTFSWEKTFSRLKTSNMHITVLLNYCTCVISWVVISMACSSSLLSSSVGRFICLSWSRASSFIFCRMRVISYWIWRQNVFTYLLYSLKWCENRCIFLQWFQFYLVDSLYPFGRQFLGDSNRSFGIQADPRHQGHPIISQLKDTTGSIKTFDMMRCENDGVPSFSKTTVKRNDNTSSSS